jgi:hypothetical protein
MMVSRRKTWTSDNWKRMRDMVRWVILHAVLTSRRVYNWRTLKEAHKLECLVPTVKHREVLWWFGQQYHGILLVPLLHFMAELLQGSTWTDWVIGCCIPWSRHYFRIMMQFCKTTVPQFTQLELFSHGWRHDELQHLTWRAQLPVLNIIEPLWSILETSMRNRFPTSNISKATWRYSSRRMVL